jgi:hypothetical protein
MSYAKGVFFLSILLWSWVALYYLGCAFFRTNNPYNKVVVFPLFLAKEK